MAHNGVKRILAAAAVAGLAAGTGLALSGCDDSKPEKKSEAKGAAAPKAASEKHACKGLNACKGQGGCAVAGKHSCKGTNECKGQGGCNM